ncbi:MAG: isoprenylcysteine carboxylmethyltransferase family protein [Bacteroidota bacterium]
MNLFIFSTGIVLYYFIHSLLVAERVKSWLIEKVIIEKYYRIIFNLLAIFGMGGLTCAYFLFEKQVLIVNDWIKWPGSLLVTAGMVWVVKALMGYDLQEFLELNRLTNNAATTENQLKKSGLNAQVRHPLYFGTLLVFWGMFFIFPNDAAFSITVISTLYILIGAKLEEKKLEQHFGEDYRLYQKHVPMLIPFRWRSAGK